MRQNTSVIIDVRTHGSDRWHDGHEPTWRDAVIGLNNGVGVVPRLSVLYFGGDWDDFGGGYDVELEMAFSYEPWDMRYKVVSVTVGEPGSMPAYHSDITSTDLREVRVAEWARVGAGRGVFLVPSPGDKPISAEEWHEYYFNPDEEVAGGDRDWLLSQVALHYQIATISSQPPAKAVERAFNAPARTAANWIARAKETGALKPVALVQTPESLKAPESFTADKLFRMQQGKFDMLEGGDGEHQEEA